MAQSHALTLRLPETAYRTAKKLAKIEGISVNAVLQVAIEEKARRSASKRLSAAYERLAGDETESGVEPLLAAQVEALLLNE